MKSEIVKVQEKIWQECRRIVRLQGNECYTCGKILESSKIQTGHLIPKKICKHLKYDLRILKVQCYFCNINLGGNGAKGLYRLINEKGMTYVNQIFIDLNKDITINLKYYNDILEKYKQIK